MEGPEASEEEQTAPRVEPLLCRVPSHPCRAHGTFRSDPEFLTQSTRLTGGGTWIRQKLPRDTGWKWLLSRMGSWHVTGLGYYSTLSSPSLLGRGRVKGCTGGLEQGCVLSPLLTVSLSPHLSTQPHLKCASFLEHRPCVAGSVLDIAFPPFISRGNLRSWFQQPRSPEGKTEA